MSVCQYPTCRYDAAAQPASTTTLTHETAARAALAVTRLPIPQATEIARPRSGRYTYRSALDCSPARSRPITGSNMITNHAHPTARYECVLRVRNAPTDIATSSAAAAATTIAGGDECHG